MSNTLDEYNFSLLPFLICACVLSYPAACTSCWLSTCCGAVALGSLGPCTVLDNGARLYFSHHSTALKLADLSDIIARAICNCICVCCIDWLFRMHKICPVVRMRPSGIRWLWVAQAASCLLGESVDIYNDPKLGKPNVTVTDVEVAEGTLLYILVVFAQTQTVLKKVQVGC